eukprot:TRINITY_DN4469_c0_g1_i1.p1 TRINITY_DN4469_c0_g1~~TRINITY_DN4469_c0_g1_i1.p1  ORF type:complete len:587 (+),score=145.49 TRINITY_DN4469_c0_g1_i1:11-1771(+)
MNAIKEGVNDFYMGLVEDIGYQIEQEWQDRVSNIDYEYNQIIANYANDYEIEKQQKTDNFATLPETVEWLRRKEQYDRYIQEYDPVGNLCNGILGENQIHPETTINLILKSGRKLPKMDTIGSIDPYCYIQFEGTNGRKVKTGKKKNKKNPVWEEIHVFSLSKPSDTGHVEFVATLWDWDRGSKDDCVGEVRLSSAELVGWITSGDMIREFPVTKRIGKKKDKGKGFLTFSIEAIYVSAEIAAESQFENTAELKESYDTKFERYITSYPPFNIEKYGNDIPSISTMKKNLRHEFCQKFGVQGILAYVPNYYELVAELKGRLCEVESDSEYVDQALNEVLSGFYAFCCQHIPEHPLYKVFEMYNIGTLYRNELLSICRFDIVLVLDDSGSMNCSAGEGKTRWDELREVSKICIEIGSALDDDGIDIIFLNRQGMENVTSYEQAAPLFSSRASGGTPLSGALSKAYERKSPEKPLIVIIATDGVPNNLDSFTRLLKQRDTENIFINCLACSDNDNDVGYLNDLDVEVPNMDVLDDFCSEKREVMRVQGEDFHYTFGDHVARVVMGSVFSKYDRLDEVKFVYEDSGLYY